MLPSRHVFSLIGLALILCWISGAASQPIESDSMLGSLEAGAPAGGGAAAGPQHSAGEDMPSSRTGCRLRGLVNWRQRPFRTSALFAAANTVLWFVGFGSFRGYSLLAILLLFFFIIVALRDAVCSRSRGANLWRSMTTSWEIIDPGQDSSSGAGLHLSDSLRVFLQETSSFKQQHPGKFCLLVCSLCTFLAVLGRYIPGIVISYIVVLGVFLWPLISSHGLKLKPVLQKLDFGVGQFFLRVKENTEKKFILTEHETLDSDLSSLFPKLNSTVCREMSVSDTEVSDVTWTENSTFNLSEGHTPQTENSDDLEKEEAFTAGFQDFPSLDNGASTNGDDDDHSLGLPTTSHHSLQPITSRQRAPHSHGDQSAEKALELVNQMAGDVITAAVTAAIQDRIEAAVSFVALCSDPPEQSGPPESNNLLEESDSEAEDFELLDQSELEQLEGELGLGGRPDQTKEAKLTSSGFFSKFLGRH